MHKQLQGQGLMMLVCSRPSAPCSEWLYYGSANQETMLGMPSQCSRDEATASRLP